MNASTINVDRNERKRLISLMREPAAARYQDGMNLYEYVKSDPIDNTDPNGTQVFPGGPNPFLPPFAPPPTTQPNPPAPTAPPTTAAGQLAYLQQVGNNFAANDSWWWFNYQCEEQAARFQNELMNDPKWKQTNPQLWKVEITGGSNMVANHNVVKLVPINGNTLPPMVLDTFHGPQAAFKNTCSCESEKDFRKTYPNPVRQK